jgi:hypothetical protein
MFEVVVCRSIEGYEDYELLPEMAQTATRALVYYRPTVMDGPRQGLYQAHFTQDFQIRARKSGPVPSSRWITRPRVHSR